MTRRRATKHDPAMEKTSFRTLARDKPVVSKDITAIIKLVRIMYFMLSCYFASNSLQKFLIRILYLDLLNKCSYTAVSVYKTLKAG